MPYLVYKGVPGTVEKKLIRSRRGGSFFILFYPFIIPSLQITAKNLCNPAGLSILFTHTGLNTTVTACIQVRKLRFLSIFLIDTAVRNVATTLLRSIFHTNEKKPHCGYCCCR